MKTLAVICLGLFIGTGDALSQNSLNGALQTDNQQSDALRRQQIARVRALAIIGQIRLLEGQRDQMQLILKLRRSRELTHFCSIKVTHLKNRISV